MKRMVVAMMVMIFATVLLISGKVFAAPIDRFIGQIAIQKEVRGESGEHKGKLFIVTHGDRLIMERDNLSGGKIWIVGIYHSHADNISSREECFVSLQRTQISSFHVAIGVFINGERIPQCTKSAN